MEAAISSIDVDVSSAAWAWPDAPWLMRRALAEIWPAEEATCTDASWMLSATRRRFATISLRLRPRVPISSRALRLDVHGQVALGHRLRGERPSTAAAAASGRREPASRPSPTPTRASASRTASTTRRRRRRLSAVWLIATSTPPFTVSARTAPAAVPSSPPVAAVTGARKSSTGSPSAVDESRSSTSVGSAAGRPRSDLAGLGEDRALRVADHRPHHVGAGLPAPLADTAPSRNCTSSGLSSVRTPYFALNARFVAM